MKIYKKIMNALAAVEKIVLVISTLLILVLTVGNVFSRKVIHRSWSFTEELVVAVFVLITLLAAALACREGELVSLTLVTDRLPKKLKKPSVILITVLSIIFSVILFKYGMDKVITQLQNGKRTFVLNWPEWIFWSFVPIGAGCMILHFIEFCLDFCCKTDSAESTDNRQKGGQINDQCNLIYLLLHFPDPRCAHRNLPRTFLRMRNPLLRYIPDDCSNKYVLRNQ